MHKHSIAFIISLGVMLSTHMAKGQRIDIGNDKITGLGEVIYIQQGRPPEIKKHYQYLIRDPKARPSEILKAINDSGWHEAQSIRRLLGVSAEFRESDCNLYIEKLKNYAATVDALNQLIRLRFAVNLQNVHPDEPLARLMTDISLINNKLAQIESEGIVSSAQRGGIIPADVDEVRLKYNDAVTMIGQLKTQISGLSGQNPKEVSQALKGLEQIQGLLHTNATRFVALNNIENAIVTLRRTGDESTLRNLINNIENIGMPLHENIRSRVHEAYRVLIKNQPDLAQRLGISDQWGGIRSNIEVVSPGAAPLFKPVGEPSYLQRPQYQKRLKGQV